MPSKGFRKTHCIRGHELTGSNVYTAPSSHKRHCLQCRKRQWKTTVSVQLCACGCGKFTNINNKTHKPNKVIKGHGRKTPCPTHCPQGHEYTEDNTYISKDNHKHCRECKRQYDRDMDPQKKRDKSAKNYKKTHYGLTPEGYTVKLELQNNLCALCGRPFVGTGTAHLAPALDHDHRTSILRDFLHQKCNQALGLLEDDPSICRMAAEYLERHKENLKCNY